MVQKQFPCSVDLRPIKGLWFDRSFFPDVPKKIFKLRCLLGHKYKPFFQKTETHDGVPYGITIEVCERCNKIK